MLSLLTRRPAATLFVARTGLNLLMAYGLGLTIEQFSTSMLFIEAVLGLFGDQTTTPNAKLSEHTVEQAKKGMQP